MRFISAKIQKKKSFNYHLSLIENQNKNRRSDKDQACLKKTANCERDVISDQLYPCYHEKQNQYMTGIKAKSHSMKRIK